MADKYPPIDTAFMEWGMRLGMTEEQVEEDWRAYCDDLEAFHEETMGVMGEPTAAPNIFCIGGSE